MLTKAVFNSHKREIKVNSSMSSNSLPFSPARTGRIIGRTSGGSGPKLADFYGPEFFEGGGGSYDSRPTGTTTMAAGIRPMRDGDILRSMLAVPQSSAATTKQQFESNGFVHYSKRIRNSDSITSSHETFVGQFVFSFRDKKATSPSPALIEDFYLNSFMHLDNSIKSVEDYYSSKATGTSRTYGGSYILLTLPQVNLTAASTEVERFDRDGVPICKTPSKLLDEWNYEGIGVTEVPLDINGKTTRKGIDGVVNFCVHGRHSGVLQVFGNGLSSQNQCYLIVKRLENVSDYPRQYHITVNGHPVRVANPAGQTVVKRPLVFIPWAKPYQERPGISDLEYTDLDGSKSMGIAIFIGKIRDAGPHVNEEYRSQAWHNARAYISLPKTEFYLAVNGRKAYNERFPSNEKFKPRKIVKS